MNIDVLQRGCWCEGDIVVHFDPAKTRPTNPRIEAEIAARWQIAISRNAAIWPGQLCRVLSSHIAGGKLVIEAGETTFRDYLGTNANPVLRFQAEHLADPLAVCAVIRTVDGRILLGRRSLKVFEHSAYWHCVGGHVEPAEHQRNGQVDVFVAIRAEISEETGIGPEALADLRCVAFLRPVENHKPELVFVARTTVEARDVQVNEEHSEWTSIPDDADSIASFLESHPVVPIGRAALSAYASISSS